MKKKNDREQIRQEVAQKYNLVINVLETEKANLSAENEALRSDNEYLAARVKELEEELERTRTLTGLEPEQIDTLLRCADDLGDAVNFTSSIKRGIVGSFNKFLLGSEEDTHD